MTPAQRRLCIEVLGWNQTQFARFIDRDPATVRRWFTGAREPKEGMDLWLWSCARHVAFYPPPGCAEKPCFVEFRTLIRETTSQSTEAA